MIGRVLLVSCLMLGASGSIGSAQQGTQISFNFQVDEAAASEVTNSAELVDFLRTSVRINAGITIDSQLLVSPRGYVGDPAQEGLLEHFWIPDLSVSLKSGQNVSDFSWSEAIEESHGDDFPDDGDRWAEQELDGWSEDKGWADLLTVVERALPESSSAFGLLADGAHHQLKVSRIEIRNFTYSGSDDNPGVEFNNCCYQEHGIPGSVILLRPDLGWDTSSYPLNDDLTVDVDVLIVHVESTASPPPPPAPESKDIARKLASQLCSMLVPGGAAEISIGDMDFKGGAVYRRGPDGEIVVVAGEVQDGNPLWCLAIASAEPVEERGSYDVVDPATMMQARTSITTVFERLGEETQLFWSNGGLVRFRIGDIAEGRLQLEGPLVHGAADARTVKATGWFEAAPLN